METPPHKDRPGSPAWKSLLARAQLALDEAALAAYRKKKDSLERRLARSMEEHGLKEAPYDFYMVQEVLVEYDRCGVFSDALRLCNGREGECIEARAWDADIWLVWDFVKARLKARMAARALDIAQVAQEGLGRLVADEECGLNMKALKMALEGAVPELYGGGAKASEDGDEEGGAKRVPVGGGGILVKIVADAAAKLEAPKSGGRSGGVYIDV
ncbi:MAG: hypothetical protein IIY62_00225 [Kiritimatiellae bacterium]|nr:hypothetical protein [Kiritimatiellia bacterium]